MAQNIPAGYKRNDSKTKRSIFGLYFKDGVLSGLNIIIIFAAIVFLGTAIYFATQFYDLFIVKR